MSTGGAGTTQSPNSTTTSNAERTRKPFPVYVNQPPPLTSSSNPDEWEMFKLLYKNYSIVNQLEEHPPTTRRAIFLSIAGPIAVKLYGSIKFKPTEDKNDVETIIKIFDEKINGASNETYERFLFNKRDQKVDETINDYIDEFIRMSKRCNFCKCISDSLLRDRMVLGIHDQQTRQLLLREADLTLESCTQICRSAEATTRQLQSMESADHRAYKVYQKQYKSY